MKVLHLTLKKKWFDMIQSGEKKEEYRTLKKYWRKRFVKFCNGNEPMQIIFRNGYSSRSRKLTVKLKRIEIGLGIIEWGAPPKESVYILKLGELL